MGLCVGVRTLIHVCTHALPGSNHSGVRTFRSRGEPGIIGPEVLGSRSWEARVARGAGPPFSVDSAPGVPRPKQAQAPALDLSTGEGRAPLREDILRAQAHSPPLS